MVKALGLLVGIALTAGVLYYAQPITASAKSPAPKTTGVTTVNGIAWQNSWAEATQLAKQLGKPILFLSMFGHIDEPMPCANARTLRATLFKDPEFMKLVSQEVIPAWEMVREVPRITIDLGDGKKIERTVRGNAVMYLCNAEGKVIDAFPGVYTKDDFMPMVRRSIENLAAVSDAKVLAYHRSQSLQSEMDALTLRARNPRLLGQTVQVPDIRAVESKSVVESPTLNLIGARGIRGARPQGPESTSEPARQRFLAEAQRVRDMSLTPMTANEVVRGITGKPISQFKPGELQREILRIESFRNSTTLRPVVKLWLASLEKLPTPMEARQDVLENLLKVPYRDPQFGLGDVLLPGTPQ